MQNADNSEYCDSGLMLTFSKPNASIHRVCSVFFHFMLFLLSKTVQQLRGKHVFRKIEIIYVWHIETSVAKKRNLVDLFKPEVDNALKYVLSKIQ